MAVAIAAEIPASLAGDELEGVIRCPDKTGADRAALAQERDPRREVVDVGMFGDTDVGRADSLAALTRDGGHGVPRFRPFWGCATRQNDRNRASALIESSVTAASWPMTVGASRSSTSGASTAFGWSNRLHSTRAWSRCVCSAPSATALPPTSSSSSSLEKGEGAHEDLSALAE